MTRLRPASYDGQAKNWNTKNSLSFRTHTTEGFTLIGAIDIYEILIEPLQMQINLEVPCLPLEKAIIHPHIPVRIPCYDLSPVTGFTLGHN